MNRRNPKRINVTIHQHAMEILRNGSSGMLLTEALAIAKVEYDRKWQRSEKEAIAK